MEGVSGRVDCSYEEEGGRLCLSQDELNIVGEAVIDDNEEEEHVGSCFPSVYVEPKC